MNQKAERIFNAIASFYGLFFGFQVKHYKKVLKKSSPNYNLLQHQTVIDVGCGTGALCYVLASHGMDVTGVDQAAKMLNVADKKLKDTKVKLVLADALKPLPFPDKSFDLAISSYTVHGMGGTEREKMYLEMARLAKKHVIFHDYNQNRSIITDIAEWLEGGNYFDFIKNPTGEMEKFFQEVRVLTVGTKAAWYICTPHTSLCSNNRE